MSLFVRIALLFVLVSASGCDQLGNPPRRSSTEPRAWRTNTVELITTTDTVSLSRAETLLAEHRGQTVLSEPAPSPGSTVATLVSVAPRFAAGLRVPQRVRLVTTVRTRTGESYRRAWFGDASSSPWLALFYLPDAPVEALTEISR